MNQALPDFMPHGMCFFWNPQILALLVSGDTLIAISYVGIATVLHFAARYLADFFANTTLARWHFTSFRNFIFLCALTHVAHIVVIWQPWYLAQGIVNFITGAVSLTTAVRSVQLLQYFRAAEKVNLLKPRT